MDDLTRQAWLKIIYLLLVVAAGFVVIGPLVGLLCAMPFYPGSFIELANLLTTNPTDPSIKIPLYVMQGGATFIGLVVLPSLWYRFAEKKTIFSIHTPQPIYLIALALAACIVVSFMVVNSVFIDWNAHVALPDFAKDFELWAREKEDLAARLTQFLTSFSSPGEFMLAFIIIAVLPGIGEELVFRGLLQPELQRVTGNAHAGIWISAILFSAFHLQFFGFIPRVFLGALFGYLYLWSGHLAMPMFAHFVNNGFSVVMIYLHQQGMVEMDMESTESAPWPAVLIFTIITFGFLFYFRKFYQQKNHAGDLPAQKI